MRTIAVGDKTHLATVTLTAKYNAGLRGSEWVKLYLLEHAS
jgi:hypothetical protein